MQWDFSPNAGFTTGTPWITPPDNYRSINAAAQMNDPDSIRSWYKMLVTLRRQEPLISDGQIEFLYRQDDRVLAYRRFDGRQELTVLCNLTADMVELPRPEGEVLLCNYPAADSALRPYECIAVKHPL